MYICILDTNIYALFIQMYSTNESECILITTALWNYSNSLHSINITICYYGIWYIYIYLKKIVIIQTGTTQTTYIHTLKLQYYVLFISILLFICTQSVSKKIFTKRWPQLDLYFLSKPEVKVYYLKQIISQQPQEVNSQFFHYCTDR